MRFCWRCPVADWGNWRRRKNDRTRSCHVGRAQWESQARQVCYYIIAVKLGSEEVASRASRISTLRRLLDLGAERLVLPRYQLEVTRETTQDHHSGTTSHYPTIHLKSAKHTLDDLNFSILSRPWSYGIALRFSSHFFLASYRALWFSKVEAN